MIALALIASSLLAAADYTVQHALSTQFRVGVMTVSIGGIYFISLRAKSGKVNMKRSAHVKREGLEPVQSVLFSSPAMIPGSCVQYD
ncbi:hypothetical protein HGG75_23975 [Ochrobactrum pseudogrignonense]|nr:hypothetical protein [Brucella pseudogrignonensis]